MKLPASLLAAAVLALGVAGAARADPLEDGVAAADRGDFPKAIGFWKPLAEAGNEFAQFDMGVLYWNGQGVAKDDAEGFRWFKLAADRGHREGQYVVGIAYEKGRGVGKDEAQAAVWFQRAGDRGHAGAEFALGLLYEEGRGVAQDSAQAAAWYRKAADRGHAKAQYNLGNLYAEGEGVPQDFQAAYLWFNLAASHFSKAEAAARADAVKNRDLAAARLTPAALAEAQKQARDWKPVTDQAPGDSREPLQ
jgi:TPR repeat protein